MPETTVTPPSLPTPKAASRAAPPIRPAPSADSPAHSDEAPDDRVLRALTGSNSMGLLVSVLLHTVVVLLMAFLVFPTNDGLQDLLIRGSTEKVDTKLDVSTLPDFSLTNAGGQSKRLVAPSELLAPHMPDFRLPDSVHLAMTPAAPVGAGNDTGKAGIPSDVKPSGNAVTVGPFTVWPEPSKPKPREPYFIMIRVKVPKKFHRKYRADDLSGSIEGNEKLFGFDNNYKQRIPWEPALMKPDIPAAYHQHTFRVVPLAKGKKPPPNGRKSKKVWLNPRHRRNILPVVNGFVIFAIKVPGADVPRIKDKIQIKSKLLKEDRKLEIVF